MKKRSLKTGDFLIAGATILAALILWGAGYLKERGDGDSSIQAVVRTADGTETRYDLSEGNEQEPFELTSGGHQYTLEFDGARVRILEADCPDQVCVTTGWLSRSGQTAACVPGRLLVRIETEDASLPDDVDAVSK